MTVAPPVRTIEQQVVADALQIMRDRGWFRFSDPARPAWTGERCPWQAIAEASETGPGRTDWDLAGRAATLVTDTLGLVPLSSPSQTLVEWNERPGRSWPEVEAAFAVALAVEVP